MPGMISPTTLLKLLTNSLKTFLLILSISLNLCGCRGVPVPAPISASKPVVVSVNWDALVRAHPLQCVRQASFVPVMGLVNAPALRPSASFALGQMPHTSSQMPHTEIKQEKPVTSAKLATKNSGQVSNIVPPSPSFRTQKQRLWEAEIGSNRLVALREAEAIRPVQAEYTQDGLLEMLQERRRVLLEAKGEAEDKAFTARVATLTTQIATIEQVQTQMPGIDLAIAVLEKQRESLPNIATLGGTFADEVARLTAQVKPETMHKKENLRRVIQEIIKQPGAYSEQARLEACVRVYKIYREGLTAQLETIRREVEREQQEIQARQKVESDRRAMARWQAQQQMAPPGLRNAVSNASLRSEPLGKMREMAQFDAEKKRLNRSNDNSRDNSRRPSHLPTTPQIFSPIVPSNQPNLLPFSNPISYQQEKQQQLQSFIEQDSERRLQEVAKEHGMVVRIEKKAIQTKNIKKEDDKTADFLKWMWAYQTNIGQANTGVRE
jgi:hypothetical protein